MQNSSVIFRYHRPDGDLDIEASSISEARRSFFKETGEFPEADMRVTLISK